MAHREALAEGLARHFRDRSSADWLAMLEAGGVPAGPVLDVCEMHADPQTRAREMVVGLDHPTAGPVETIGLPVKFSGTPGGVRRPAPRLGEHTVEVLAEHGIAEADARAMLADWTGAAG